MDDMLVKLFNEVEYVWPKVGYPPLVTPFSQYTKNIALMNLLTIEQGKGRYVMMDDAIWGMILGKSGKVPGTIDPEFIELAKKQNREFTTADPHTLQEGDGRERLGLRSGQRRAVRVGYAPRAVSSLQERSG